MDEVYQSYIKGMTCLSCEDIILQNLYSLKGVIKVDLSYWKSSIQITYDQTLLSKEEIEEFLNKIGYPASEKKENNLLLELCTFILIGIAFLFLKYVHLPAIPELKNNASILLVFIVGLFTGTHCICMCGGIMLSVMVSTNKKAFLEYQLGRITISMVLGLLFSAMGKALIYSIKIKSMIYVIAGILVLFIGICRWGIIPLFRQIESLLPKICHFNNKSILNNKYAFVVGILNGLLPCSASSVMWAYCTTLNSILNGMITMLVWCLGTTIFMTIFALTSNFMTPKKNLILQRLSTIFMLALGLKMLLNGIKMM